jgi:hypothetical protein
MLTDPTIDQLRALKLDGMADAFVELETQDRSAIQLPETRSAYDFAHIEPARPVPLHLRFRQQASRALAALIDRLSGR